MDAGTGPLNHHKHHEDNIHKDNSRLLLLLFSIDVGATYYNYNGSLHNGSFG